MEKNIGEVIGKYEHFYYHVGQFTLPIDAGCFNKERTEMTSAAKAYIQELTEFPIVSENIRKALEEGFIKKFCLYRYN